MSTRSTPLDADLETRDVEYHHGPTRLLGAVVAPHPDSDLTYLAESEEAPRAGVLLLHDAFGLSEEMFGIAGRLAALGHPVFAADIWGERTTPTSEPEIGPLIGSMASDRVHWLGRLRSALATVRTQPELADRPLVILGYCFGGSSALELLRTGTTVDGVIAIHPGLDLLAQDWSAPGSAAVLVGVGSADPMATLAMQHTLAGHLDALGADWQLHLYGGAKHAFTSPKAAHSPLPEVVAYDPRSAERAWSAIVAFLDSLAAPTR